MLGLRFKNKSCPQGKRNRKNVFWQIQRNSKIQSFQISHFYSYVKSYENTTFHFYKSLRFKPKRKFYCFIESFQELTKK